MIQRNQLDNYDVVFAGGGFSSAMVLTYMLRCLCARSMVRNLSDCRPVQIAVFDDKGRFPRGLAYSEEDCSAAFLITPASEAMPPISGGGNELTIWLTHNLAEWSNRLWEAKDPVVTSQLPNLISHIEDRRFERVFLPRSVMGWFVAEIASEAIRTAEMAGYADIEIREGEVNRVKRERRNGSILLDTTAGENFSAEQLIVGIGSGNFRSLAGPQSDSSRYIASPLDGGVSALKSRIKPYFNNSKSAASQRILIIGSNASALDALVVLLQLGREYRVNVEVVSISPSGQFPSEFKFIETNGLDGVLCPSLSALIAGLETPTAAMLYDCAVADRALFIKQGQHIGEAKTHIYKKVLKVIDRLEPAEKREFAEVYGNDLSRKFYMTSPIYSKFYREAIERGDLISLVE
jgi:uncharacterized NAD(P)/FAD-binding protein YdhS